jgi:hypothetical protein
MPDHRSSAVGKVFVATARLTKGVQPVEGSRVDFTATMERAPTLRRHGTTDGRGQTAFHVVRRLTGVDSLVVAYVLSDGTTVEDGVVHSWIAGKPPPGGADVSLSDSIAPPGADVRVTGDGCTTNRDVRVGLDGRTIATTTANEDGAYETTVSVPPGTSFGSHSIIGTCGSVLSTVALNVAASHGLAATPAVALTTTAAVLLFFFLLGGELLRVGGDDSSDDVHPS